MPVNIGVTFGEGAHGGQVVFLELVGQQAEPPAEHHHVSGGKGERENLRRRVLIVLGVGIGFQGVFDQLAGMKATALREAGLRLGQVELDAGAILAGSGVRGIIVNGPFLGDRLMIRNGLRVSCKKCEKTPGLYIASQTPSCYDFG